MLSIFFVSSFCFAQSKVEKQQENIEIIITTLEELIPLGENNKDLVLDYLFNSNGEDFEVRQKDFYENKNLVQDYVDLGFKFKAVAINQLLVNKAGELEIRFRYNIVADGEEIVVYELLED